jgi:hypothetical protein
VFGFDRRIAVDVADKQRSGSRRDHGDDHGGTARLPAFPAHTCACARRVWLPPLRFHFCAVGWAALGGVCLSRVLCR